MNARAHILAKLKAASVQPAARAAPYGVKIIGDLATEFSARAKAADGEMHALSSADDIPALMQKLFAQEETPTKLHIAQGSPLRALPWDRAPLLVLDATPPGGEAIALSAADFAIAETGTLAFRSGPSRPSSWHFLPGIECVVLPHARIVPTLEDVLAQLALAAMPATLNFVTGPSRTADIEQTIERGAHGPRALHVFLVAD